MKSLTADPAATVGLLDRGVLSVGRKADLNVIDYDRLRLAMPHVAYDLPAGGRRVTQGASGYDAMIVAGQVVSRGGEPTGALPGRLVRGPAGRAELNRNPSPSGGKRPEPRAARERPMGALTAIAPPVTPPSATRASHGAPLSP